LVGGEDELDIPRLELAHQVARAQGVDPGQLAVLRLGLVELLEHLHAFHLQATQPTTSDENRFCRVGCRDYVPGSTHSRNICY
jgi:hypothetical protein